MIQDIFPHIYHNEYKPVVPDSNSIILAYENGDRISLRQPLLQRVNAPVTSLCLIPIPLKNIYDAICGNEAKRSF